MGLIRSLDQCNYAFHCPKPKTDGCGIFNRDLTPVVKQGTWIQDPVEEGNDLKRWKALKLPVTKSHQPKQWPQTSGPILVSLPLKKQIHERW